MARPPKGPGLKLARNKDKESYCSHNSRNVQFELEAPTCQFQHGIRPVYAGSAANWLRVGYLLHAVAWRGSRLTANGLERQLGCLSLPVPVGLRTTCNRTLSRVVARQLGLLTQVRYPARGSARVTSLKQSEEDHLET